MSLTPTPSRSDRAALWLTIVLGAGAAVYTAVRAVTRILEIASNRDVPVPAAFADTPATMPIGPGGADVEVAVETVILRASDMPPVTLWSLILAEVVYALAVVVTVALVTLVIRNLIRGRAFDRATVGLVGTAVIVVGVGWILTWLFRTMGANGGASALAGERGTNTPIAIEPLMLFAIAAMGGLAAAFQIGHRLQRDAEGLV